MVIWSSRRAADEGFVYRASDDAASYVDLLETTYSIRFEGTALDGLASKCMSAVKRGFKTYVREQIGDWSEAFGPSGGRAG